MASPASEAELLAAITYPESLNDDQMVPLRRVKEDAVVATARVTFVYDFQPKITRHEVRMPEMSLGRSAFIQVVCLCGLLHRALLTVSWPTLVTDSPMNELRSHGSLSCTFYV